MLTRLFALFALLTHGIAVRNASWIRFRTCSYAINVMLIMCYKTITAISAISPSVFFVRTLDSARPARRTIQC